MTPKRSSCFPLSGLRGGIPPRSPAGERYSSFVFPLRMPRVARSPFPFRLKHNSHSEILLALLFSYGRCYRLRTISCAFVTTLFGPIELLFFLCGFFFPTFFHQSLFLRSPELSIPVVLFYAFPSRFRFKRKVTFLFFFCFLMPSLARLSPHFVSVHSHTCFPVGRHTRPGSLPSLPLHVYNWADVDLLFPRLTGG